MELSAQIMICVISAMCLVIQARNLCMTPGYEVGKYVPKEKCSTHVNVPSIFSLFQFLNSILYYFMESDCRVKNTVDYVCCATNHILSEVPSLPLINEPNCGKVLENKISNGDSTELGEFPWVAQLLYDASNIQCGGSLINKRYVLTAAHCVTKTENVLSAVRLGEYDTSKDNDCYIDGKDCMPPVQDIPVKQIILHPEHNITTFSNDIALLRLKYDAEINNRSVLPICLPVTEALQKNPLGIVTIAGWGLTEKNARAIILQKAVIPVVSNEECQRVLKRSTAIPPSEICAGGKSGVGSCKGDSGGPLFGAGRIRILNRDYFRYVQYGIDSVGPGGCEASETVPRIFIRVSYYMKWISEQLKPQGLSCT